MARLPRYLECKSYSHILTLGWGDDHHANPTWLPQYLDALATALNNRLQPSTIDVLGLSRGHQSLLFACARTPQQLHLKLATRFRSFMGAGGCIWQQSDPTHLWDTAKAVQAGLKDMDTVRGAPMFRLIVLSRTDGTTEWSGDIAIAGEKRKAKPCTKTTVRRSCKLGKGW